LKNFRHQKKCRNILVKILLLIRYCKVDFEWGWWGKRGIASRAEKTLPLAPNFYAFGDVAPGYFITPLLGKKTVSSSVG